MSPQQLGPRTAHRKSFEALEAQCLVVRSATYGHTDTHFNWSPSVAPGRQDESIHRAIIGEEAMMLNGFPTNDRRFSGLFAEESNSSLQNLAGNGFPSTIIAAFIIAIQFCLQEGVVPKEEARPAGDDECEAALSLLKRARRS